MDAALGRLAGEYAQVQAQAEGARDVDEVAKRKEKEREWLSGDFCAGASG